MNQKEVRQELWLMAAISSCTKALFWGLAQGPFSGGQEPPVEPKSNHLAQK